MSRCLSLPRSFYKRVRNTVLAVLTGSRTVVAHTDPFHFIPCASLQAGPREYLIVQVAPDPDNISRLHLSLPEESLFEFCWRQVIDHSFPRAPAVQDSAFLQYLTDLGEFYAIQQHLHCNVDPTIWILTVPRTFYELTALVLHAFDRATSNFGVFDPNDSECSILEPFYFDHKSTVKNITSDLLLRRADAAVSKKSLLKVAQNLNWVLVCFLLRASNSGDNSGQLRSILDLDLESDSISGSHDQIASWMAGVEKLDFEALADVLLDDLTSIERGYPSSISSSYDLWPLSSPFVQTILDENPGEETRIRESFPELEKDLMRLQACILQHTEASLSEANAILASLRRKSTEGDTSAYGALAGVFCPEVIQTETLPSRFSELKRFVSQLDVVRRADPFISAIRQPGFFAERQFVKKVLAEERLERTRDFAFLFRGSVDLQHESFSTLQQTISPAQYGLELGSSSDYTNLDANPCKAHSMSFGSSLFAGLLYDPTASVWTYWSSKRTSDGYIVQLPIDEHLLSRLAADLAPSCNNPSMLEPNNSSSLATLQEPASAPTTSNHFSDWLFIPPLPTLVALAGSGELWHPRSKCGIPSSHRADSFHFISGMLNCSYRRVPSFLLIPDQQPPNFQTLPIFRIKHP